MKVLVFPSFSKFVAKQRFVIALYYFLIAFNERIPKTVSVLKSLTNVTLCSLANGFRILLIEPDPFSSEVLQ